MLTKESSISSRLDSSGRFSKQYRALVRLTRSKRIASGSIERALQEICAVAAQTLGVERVSVWIFRDHNQKIECVELFKLSEQTHESGGELLRDQYPIYFDNLEVNRAIVASDAVNDPATSEFRASYLEPLGIGSLLDAPIRRRGEVVGIVCHEHVGPPRIWHSDEVHFSASIADLVALSLETAQHVQAEHELRDSEDRFKRLAECSLEGVALHQRGQILEANQRYAEMFGYRLSEIIGKSVFDLVAPKSQPQLQKAIRSGLEEPYEVTFVRRNGSEFAAEVIPRNCRFKGQLVRVAVVRDITNQKRAEYALRESEANFRALAENANDGILIGAGKGKYAYANSKCTEITGYTVEELVNQSIWDIVHPDDRPEIERKYYSRLKGTEPTKQYESKLVHKLGHEVPIEVTAARTDWQSKPAVLAIIRDITRRKKQERQLLRMQQELEKRVEERTRQLKATHEKLVHSEKLSAVGKLAASVAHEFNNPLFGIRNVLERVDERGSNDATTKNLVKLAIRECGRVSELIHKLQEFNRPSSGKTVQLDLHEAINDIVQLYERKLTSRGVTVRTAFDPGLPKIPAIEDQLKQVILNLLSNAEESIGEGGGEIEITTSLAGNMVRLQISDNGSGIDEASLPFIFEPFFTTKSTVKGTGLGLSVTHGIVKRHGGSISVRSSKLGGAEFTVLLPLEGA